MRLIALTTTGFLLMSAATVLAQEGQPGRATDQRPGTPSATQAAGLDRAAAIGHALCMSIEGSELWACAEASGQTRSEPRTDQASDPGSKDYGMPLKKHAMESFASSKRLFDAVTRDDSAASEKSKACEEFYQAARRYGEALEACCKEGGSTPERQADKSMSAARMTLINHAVKEAVGAAALRSMIQHHGDQSAVGSALLSHATEMRASSRAALESVGGRSSTRDAARPVPTETGKTELPRTERAVAEAFGADREGDLLAHAKAVIDAVNRLEGQTGEPVRRAERTEQIRENTTPNRDNPNPNR